MRSLVLFALSLLTVSTSYAGVNDQIKKYYSLQKPEVQVTVEELPLFKQIAAAPTAFTNPNDCERNSPGLKDFKLEDMTDINNIINFGKEVWQLIEDNKPVVNVKLSTANALPANVKCWDELSGWQTPKTLSTTLTYKNLYGMEVVKFKYRLVYTYGGGFDGVGSYLTNVTVLPAELNVAWGFTFNADIQIPNIVNVGTSKSPVGAMQVDVKWQVDTPLKSMQNVDSYFVRGDGQAIDLNN